MLSSYTSLFKLFVFLFLLFANNVAQASRTSPVFDNWIVDCGNTGVCFSSSFSRNQSVWIDVRFVRDWQADAKPLLRLTTNKALPMTGAIIFEVNGIQIEKLPIEQLREMQSSVSTPNGFSPLGGEGFWYPTGPATQQLLDAMQSGSQLTVSFEEETEPDLVSVHVDLAGLKASILWLDNLQDRTGTQSAIVAPGNEPAKDAPYAISITSTDQLPPEVLAVWGGNKLCGEIDLTIFAGLNAVRAPVAEETSIYLIPCGTPGAHNSTYVALLSAKDGSARQLQVVRMSDKGPIATDLIYNARWIPAKKELISYYKGSGIGECGIWNRWLWNGTGLVLLEEATRANCDGTQPDLPNWSSSWPIKNEAN